MEDTVNDLFGRIHFFKSGKGELTQFEGGTAVGTFPTVMAYDASRRRFLFRTPVSQEEVMDNKVTTYIRNAISEEQISQILEEADPAIWKYGSADEDRIGVWREQMRSSLDFIKERGVGTFVRIYGFGQPAVMGTLIAGQVMVHLHKTAQRI